MKRIPEKLGSDRKHFASAIKARARSSRPPWPRIIGSACCIRVEALFAWLEPRESHNSASVRVADALRRSKLNDWQNERLANAYGRPKTALPDFWEQWLIYKHFTAEGWNIHIQHIQGWLVPYVNAIL